MAYSTLDRVYESIHRGSRAVKGSPYLRNAAWMVVDKVFRTAGGAVVWMYLARVLGPGDYGALSFVFALIAPALAVATLGMGAVLLRDLVKREGEGSMVLASAFYLRIVVGGICGLFILAIFSVTREASVGWVFIAGLLLTCLVTQAADVVETYFQRTLSTRDVVVARSTVFAVCTTARIIILWQWPTLLLIAMTFAAENLLTCIALLRLSKRVKIHWGLRNVQWSYMLTLISACVPLVAGGLATAVYLRVDQVVVGYSLGEQSVGMLAASVRLTELWYLVPVAVVTSAYSKLTALSSENPAAYYSKLRKLNGILLGGSILFTIMLSLFARPIVVGVYGARFEECVGFVRVHAWCAIFVTLGVCVGPVFVNAGRLWYPLLQTALGGVVALVGNLVFTPQYGLMAVAWVALAANIISAVGVNACFKSTREILRLQLMMPSRNVAFFHD